MTNSSANLKKDIINLTSTLVKFKTTKDNPDELKKLIDFVAKYFSKEKVSTKRFNKNKKPSVVILPKGIKKPKVFFLCHSDVVPAESDKDFVPVLKGNKLFARGSGDMKAGLAVAMILFKKYYKNHSIGLIITTDEEIGGKSGSGIIYKQFKSDFIIAPEPSKLNIIFKEKGLLWIKLIAKGKASHGARPWRGINPFDLLIKAYSKLRKKIPHITKECWQTTMNLSIMKGGGTVNAVPKEAEMTLDIRRTERYKPEQLINLIKKTINDKRIQVKILENQPMMTGSEKNKHIVQLSKSFRKVMKKKPVYKKEHGASDARYFSNIKIPCVIFGHTAKNIHGKNEYVLIDSCVKSYKVYEQFIKDWC